MVTEGGEDCVFGDVWGDIFGWICMVAVLCLGAVLQLFDAAGMVFKSTSSNILARPG
jgi:hypothetical protein